MLPEFDLAGISIKTFGLIFAIGFLVAGALLSRRFSELKWQPEQATEMLLSALLGGVIGARLYWLFDNWSETKDDFAGSLFGSAGLTWYGGVLGGTLAVIAWAKWRNKLSWQLTDVAAAPMALGYAIGRVGCQVSGDGDYGKPSDLPWAMAYPDGAVPTDVKVHPTPIYESIWMFLFAILLWNLRDRFSHGTLFAIYLIGAGIERFVIEFWRSNQASLIGLTTAQLTSVVMIVGGAVLFWLKRNKPAKAASV